MKNSIILMAVATLTMVACCNKTDVAQFSEGEASIANLMSRKSVRQFTGDTIPSATMETLLRAAQAAPSGRDWRPWSFVVLTDKSQYDNIFGDNFNMRMYKESGAVVIVCADTIHMGPTRDNPDGPAVAQPNQLWRDDMGAVTENLLLAVEACGLGACWTACYPWTERMAPIKEALGLPASVVPYAVVPIGVPASDNQPKDKWDPSRIHYGRW